MVTSDTTWESFHTFCIDKMVSVDTTEILVQMTHEEGLRKECLEIFNVRNMKYIDCI